MGYALHDGLYEHLVTEALARALTDTNAVQILAELDDADAHLAVASHLGAEIKRALSSLPVEERASRARDVAAQVIEHLASLLGEDAAELLREQVPSAPPRRLMALHRGAIPDRPATPLATSTLLTRGSREPALGHELSREIATADQIDAIIAFVTVGGVRAISDALQQFS